MVRIRPLYLEDLFLRAQKETLDRLLRLGLPATEATLFSSNPRDWTDDHWCRWNQQIARLK